MHNSLPRCLFIFSLKGMPCRASYAHLLALLALHISWPRIFLCLQPPL